MNNCIIADEDFWVGGWVGILVSFEVGTNVGISERLSPLLLGLGDEVSVGV